MEDRKKYDLIRCEFNKMLGRFDVKPSIMLLMPLMCGLVILLNYVIVQEAEDDTLGWILFIVILVNYLLVWVASLTYYLLSHRKRGRRVFPFAIFLNLEGLSFYIIIFVINLWRNRFGGTGVEDTIGLFVILGMIGFFIGDSIRFHYLAGKGRYNENAESYPLKKGKKELVVIIVVGILLAPAKSKVGRGSFTRYGLSDQITDLYVIILFCIVACLIHRIMVKAWINLVVCRTWIGPEEKLEDKKGKRRVI